MGSYILKRLLGLIPIMWGLSFIVFLTIYLAPGDAASKLLLSQGIAVEQEVIAGLREEMGLHRSFPAQYGDWLLAVLRGDLGLSFRDGKPVLEKLLRAGGYTFVLSFAGLGTALLLALPLGFVSAVYKDSFADHLIKLGSFISNAMPNFLLSVLLIYVFAIQMKLFPVIAGENLQGLVLPTLSLALPIAGRFIRQIRAEVLTELDKPYVSGLRQRGLKEQYVLFSNILHNCLAPVLTVAALSLGTLLGGSVVTEAIFNWQGLGTLLMSAITNRDYPVIQGFVLFIGVFYVLINLFTDISYRMLDPRISLE